MGACVTRHRELEVGVAPFSDSLQPGEVKFYGIHLSEEWSRKKLDLLVRVHVEQGRLSTVYCARDRSFPNQRRKIWSTNRYCSCPSPTCDHCYPHCLNTSGGLCIDCMVHDDKWERTSHEVTLGGMSDDEQPKGSNKDQTATTTQEISNEIVGAIGGAKEDGPIEMPYYHQTDYEFSLRLSPTLEPHLLTPGHFFLTVEAAPELVPRAIRKKRRLEGDDEYHTTKYSIWIEERSPRGRPQLGNEERVAETNQRTKERIERATMKREFGRKVDEFAQKKKEEMMAKGEIGQDHADRDERKKAKASSTHDQATAPASEVEEKKYAD